MEKKKRLLFVRMHVLSSTCPYSDPDLVPTVKSMLQLFLVHSTLIVTSNISIINRSFYE